MLVRHVVFFSGVHKGVGKKGTSPETGRQVACTVLIALDFQNELLGE